MMSTCNALGPAYTGGSGHNSIERKGEDLIHKPESYNIQSTK